MNGSQAPEAAASGALSASDLSQVLSLFNEAAAKLQTTHDQLRSEVGRLQGELKAANEEIARSRHLAALGEMAAGIAHEVRNPLGSIRLHARMLEEDLTDRPEQGAIARKILQAVRGLDAVVGDVLAFSRELKPSERWCDPEAVLVRAIEESLASFVSDSRGGGVGGVGGGPAGSGDRPEVEVVVTADGGEAGELWCDPDMLHRALVNVIQNALQAMHPETTEHRPNDETLRRPCALSRRPRLVAGASSRRVMTPDGGERRMVVLSVRDTGPGLPSEVMQRMFNPFFTTRATGTGLGLAIVHRIIDAHGGSVRVRNHEQGGAVIELLLPGEQSAERAQVVVKRAGRAHAPAA